MFESTLIRRFLFLAALLTAGFANAQTIRYQNSIRGGLAVATNGLNLTSSTVFANTAGGTTMSSYSDLVLPSDASIVKAILYVEGYAAQNITSVKFKTPAMAAFATLTTTSPGFIAGPSTGSYTQFIMDVTSLMPTTGFVSTVTAGGNAGTTGRYSIADLSPIDQGNYGYGWSIFVVYSRPVGQYRNVTIADACVNFGIGTANTFDINGIAVPSAGSVNAIVVATGCWGDPGPLYMDNIKFGKKGGTLTSLKDPVTGSTTDVLNGTVGFCVPNNVTVDGVAGMTNGNYVARNPYNTFGGTQKSAMYYDCDMMNASGILAPSTTPISVTITQAGQGSDALGVGAYGVSVDIVSALLTKSLTPTTIGDGEVATYTFFMTNNGTGSNNQTGIGFTDNLPAGLMIANPNGVVVTGGIGGTVTAVPGSGTFTLSNFGLNAGQTATITLKVTNKPGQLNPDCGSNPAAFTNGFANIANNTANLANGVNNVCLIVTGAPKPDFTATTVCEGVATQFTDITKVTGSNVVTNWNWDFGNGVTSTLQNPSITFAAAGTYTVKLEITATSGAKERITKTITVKALPTVVVKDPPGICPGSSAQLDVSGGDTYLWSPAGSLSNPAIAKPIATPTSTTTYTVKVTDSQTGCSKDATSLVTVFAKPIVVISGATTICPDVNSTLTATGGIAYKWTPGGQTTPTITINQTAETTYGVEVTDANGCKATQTYKVAMAAPITNANLTTVPRACASANGTITINGVVGGSSPYQYSLNSTTYKTTNSFGSLDSLEYLITIKDSKGCLRDTTVKVGITQSPTKINFTTAPSGCGAPTGKITVSSVTGGKAPYQYSSSGTAGTFQTSLTLAPLGSGDYQLTVRDANGCEFSELATVGSSSGPTGLVSATTADSCGKHNGSIVVNSVIDGMAPFSYSLDNVNFQSSPSFGGLTTGNITVYVKDAGNCVYSKVVNIPAVTGVSVFTLSSVTESCNLRNGSVDVSGISGGTAPYEYSLNAGPFQPGALFANLDSGSYTVTVRGQDLCPISKQISVGYLPPIDSVHYLVTPSTCSGPNAKVVFTPFGGTAPMDVTHAGTTQLYYDSITGLLAGNYVFHFTDSNSCTFNLPVTITDIAGPSAMAVTTQQTSCTAPTGVITIGGVTGGTMPYAYALNSGAFTAATSYSSLGQGPYAVRVRDANGCNFVVDTVVTVVNGPNVINTTEVNTTCSQNNGQITILGSSGGTGPYDYSFNGSAFSSTMIYPNLVAGDYTIVARDANQCTVPKGITLVDSPGPTDSDVRAWPTSCGRNLGKFNVLSVTGGTAPYTYSLDGSAFTTDTYYQLLSAGMHRLVIHDANQCVIRDSAVVFDVAGPSGLKLVAAHDTCARNSGRIAVQSVQGPSRAFTFSITGRPLQGDSLFVNVPASATPYTYTVQDTSGCTVTDTISVRAIAGPSNPSVTFTQPHCGKPDGSILVNRNSMTSGTAPFVFVLSPVSSPTGDRFDGLSAGMNYTVTVTDKYNCTNFNVQPYVLTDIPGPQQADLVSVESTCGLPNGTVEIHQVVGFTPPYRYSQDGAQFGPDSVFSSQLPATQKSFYIQDAAGCVLEMKTDIGGAPGPTDILYTSLPENCYRADGALNGVTAFGGTAPYTLSGLQAVLIPAPASLTGIAKGSYAFTVTDVNGCSYSKDLEVGFAPGPTAEFEMSYDEESEAPLTVIFRNHSTGAVTQNWKFGDEEFSADHSPMHTYQDSGRYNIVLVVENNAGCLDSASENLRVKPAVAVYIPNTFSPNNDGVNDRFSITTYNIVSYTVTVYNRWGQVVANFTERKGFWEGEFEGNQVEQGVYAVAVTAIDVFSKKHHHKGVVNVVR
ncbi:MAG: PKD domain-containing protein [Bacteroidota bacterium]